MATVLSHREFALGWPRRWSASSSAASGASSPGTPALVIEPSLIGFLPSENRRGVQEPGDDAREEAEQQREERGCGDRSGGHRGGLQRNSLARLLGFLHVHEH